MVTQQLVESKNDVRNGLIAQLNDWIADYGAVGRANKLLVLEKGALVRLKNLVKNSPAEELIDISSLPVFRKDGHGGKISKEIALGIEEYVRKKELESQLRKDTSN